MRRGILGYEHLPALRVRHVSSPEHAIAQLEHPPEILHVPPEGIDQQQTAVAETSNGGSAQTMGRTEPNSADLFLHCCWYDYSGERSKHSELCQR